MQVGSWGGMCSRSDHSAGSGASDQPSANACHDDHGDVGGSGGREGGRREGGWRRGRRRRGRDTADFRAVCAALEGWDGDDCEGGVDEPISGLLGLDGESSDERRGARGVREGEGEEGKAQREWTLFTVAQSIHIFSFSNRASIDVGTCRTHARRVQHAVSANNTSTWQGGALRGVHA